MTDAVIAVGAGLDLDDVLQRLVNTAAVFSGAQYGALGITGAGGDVVRFVTYGISDEVRAKLGDVAPNWHGISGLLLRPDARPLRLTEITDHPASVGFPPNHPPMRTFLGVPVRVSGEIFGNLYVAEKHSVDGSRALFTAEDEEALLALGAAAGVAVENARLYDTVRRRQRWSDAVGRANHAIIARSDRDTRARLAAVPAIARAAGGSDLAFLAFRQADGEWVVRYADAADDVAATTVGTCVPDDVAERLAPDAVTEWGADQLGWLPGTWAAAVAIPVHGSGGELEAALVLVHRQDRDPALGEADRTSELDFGQRLGLALEVAQAHADAAALALLRDRDRIARDLHDHVIQRLFAIGLSLQAAGVAARVPEVQTRLKRAVTDIDQTIQDVRRTIFELHAAADQRSDLRQRVDEIIAEVSEHLTATVHAHIEDGLDDVPPDLGHELVAVLREALTNVARHARATTLHVYVTVGRDLEVEVVDDGIGMPGAVPAGEGLPNLTARAAAREGVFEITPTGERGTALRWSVPLP